VLFGKALVLTPWKIVGYSGATIFFLRWPVQMWASRRAGKPVVPTLFWIMSIAGSFTLLAYFMFGKTDSVGVLSNMFPAFVSVYNLILDIRHRKALEGGGPPAPTTAGGGRGAGR
jgi:lipid-A-disaccharide synthase-like uncharacterized protein